VSRRSTALLVVVCAAAQAAPAGPVLAVLLSFALHAGPHAHDVTYVADQGHAHLVLSHGGDRDHHEIAPPDLHDHAGSLSGDHVFDIANEDAGSAPSRRAESPAPAIVSVDVASTRPARPAIPRPAPEPRARGTGLLTTVVLLI
jgi:hypothetical protein